MIIRDIIVKLIIVTKDMTSRLVTIRDVIVGLMIITRALIVGLIV